MRQKLTRNEEIILEQLNVLLSAEFKRRKCKIKTIAEETGLDRDSVRKIINGETNPSFIALHRVCKALDVKINFTYKEV